MYLMLLLNNGHWAWSMSHHEVAHTSQYHPLNCAKTSASQNQRVQLQIFNGIQKFLSYITPVQFYHNVNLFLSGGGVKQIKNLCIILYAIVLHNLFLSELCQRNKRRTRFCPQLVTIIRRIGIDVDDVKGVAFISQVFDGPFESNLAAIGEVQCNTNLSILYHGF
uniref:Uncharacterized protein n=1 Tax=Glycine max TaxID=3847 RepID=C6SZ32_SOYBN|nr:unknown [Glycine max]